MSEPGSASHGGDDIDRLEIALRVASDDLDPDRITRMLGVNPTFAARMGEEVDVDGVPIVQPTGSWRYALPASPEWELGDAIHTLLEQLPGDPAERKLSRSSRPAQQKLRWNIYKGVKCSKPTAGACR